MQRRRGHRRITAVDQHLHLSLPAAQQIVGVIRRHAHADFDSPRCQRSFERFVVEHAIDDRERARVLKRFEQLARMPPTVQVIHNRWDVLDFELNRIAKNQRLQHRHHQHEEDRRRLATNVRELFEQHRPQAPEGTAGRCRASVLREGKAPAEPLFTRRRLGGSLALPMFDLQRFGRRQLAFFLRAGQRHEDIFQTRCDRPNHR